MIKKILTFLLIQIILYTIFVYVVDLSWVKHQSFEQSNSIKAEQYLFETSEVRNRPVFVGTSLTAILTDVDFPEEYINLGFHGQSTLAGLEVLRNKKQKPQIVYIEMNMVLLSIYDQVYKEVQNIYAYYPKKYLPILRQKARPIEMIGSSFFEIMPSIYRKLTNQAEPKKELIDEPENSLKASQIIKQKKDLSIKPSSALVDSCFQLIAPIIKELKQQGVCIVFYEVPLEGELCNLNQPSQIREHFYKEYPPSEYHYIQQPNCKDYKTTDGLHLTLKSAKKYAAYFLEQVKKIKC